MAREAYRAAVRGPYRLRMAMMKRHLLALTEANGEPPSRQITTPTGVATYVGEAECPQCEQLGDRHTKDCPHNLGPRDGK
ncbi:MAG: hypothetical protein R3268_04565 [Acidiferrobacterales bacterium]|nr:hypothetical protein [Acidiferrobacterales bacterium]